MLLAEPFRHNSYDFGVQSVTREVKDLIPIMLKYRLKPPPDATYSLHRKLSGAFLLCAKMKARVPCKPEFDRVMAPYNINNLV